MVERIKIIRGTKEEKYLQLISIAASLVEKESDNIANMANIVAVIKETFDFHWVGFYRVMRDELVLGPFQGTLACTRIKRGNGVCGTAWLEKRTLIIPDVDLFPGHIACSSLSRSEIVVPVFIDQEVVAVLDIDSVHLNGFDELDKTHLEKITSLIRVHADHLTL